MHGELIDEGWGGTDDIDNEKDDKGEESSEEDVDEGEYGDVQESRPLQSTPKLDTQSRDNQRRNRHPLQATPMSKAARTIAKRMGIMKIMDSAASPRVC